MALVTDIAFNGSITDTTGGSEIITIFGSDQPINTPENSSSTFGSDINGAYWSWAAGQIPGGGISIETDLRNGTIYTIALRFSYQQVSGYRKIIDFKDQVDDTGFYLLSGRINYYPLGTGERVFSENEVVDLIATRDADGYFTVYTNDGQGGYVQQIRVADVGNSSVPSLVDGKYRLGFFFDDLATSSEYTPGGNVWNLRIWDEALLPSQISQALSANPPTSATPTDSIPPTAAITVADADLKVGETSAVTITFSEAVTGFSNADLTVENGSLSAVSSSDGGITWTATLTPTADLEDSTNLITLDNTGVADTANNAGTGTTESNNYSIDTKLSFSSLAISADTDTGAEDNITSVGLPILTFFGDPGLTVAILGGDSKTLLTPNSQYIVSYSNGTYTISLIDADPTKDSNQPFGTYSQGAPTGNPANTADGIYTIDITDAAGNAGTVGSIILATAGLDNDGADDTFEAGKDGNDDGFNDAEQRSVATFATSDGSAATIAVKLIEQTTTTDPQTGGRLDATTSILFDAASTAETGTGATISGLQNTVNQDPDNSNLPQGAAVVVAVSDQPSFRIVPEIVRTGVVDPTQEANFRSDVTDRFSDTIQQVDLFFEEGQQTWNSLFKRDASGGYFFFGYNPSTGLGGVLLDRDNNGAVDGARLFLKDGEIGDLDGQRNGVIQDPVGLASLFGAPTLRVSNDNLGLIVDGVAGTGLWLNIEALSAAGSWQNGLELITSDGTALGAVGATPASGNLGSKEIYLAAGQELRFAQSSRNNALDTTPDIRLVADNGGFRLRLDDNGSSDRDYNDLELRITSSLTASNPNAIAMARHQRDSSDAILDLTSIPAAGATLDLSILTNSGYTNRFGLVKLDGDAITGYSVASVAAANTDAFRNAVRDNLINPGGSPIAAGGQTARTTSWALTAADAGIYAAVLINPNGQVFTFGATASDGQRHVKVLGDNTFGFEDLLASQGSDWDFNDFRVRVSLV